MMLNDTRKTTWVAAGSSRSEHGWGTRRENHAQAAAGNSL